MAGSPQVPLNAKTGFGRPFVSDARDFSRASAKLRATSELRSGKKIGSGTHLQMASPELTHAVSLLAIGPTVTLPDLPALVTMSTWRFACVSLAETRAPKKPFVNVCSSCV